MGDALTEYAAARLGGSRYGFTPEGAARRLVEAGAEPEAARRFRALLSRSEGARFAAPRGGDAAHSDGAEAAELIRQLEDQLGRGGEAG